jgi:curved DNA-binding protein
LESAFPDHYATLGLDRRCTIAQVRSAYRLLAKRFHPDLNPDSPEALERTQELNTAHEVLSDPVRKRAYDRDLAAAQGPPPPRGAGKLERNVAQDVHLRIEELLRGTVLTVRVDDPGNPNGPETYELSVPEETAPGARFRIPRSEPFTGGFVTIRIKVLPGARFKARGSDLRCDLRIQARRAAQGGNEMIVGPTGKPLHIPLSSGIGRGEIVRIPGQGLPKPRGGRGDLLVRITYRPEIRVSRMGR